MIQQKKRTAGRRDAGHSLRMWSSVSFFGTRSKPQGGTLLEESRLLEAQAEIARILPSTITPIFSSSPLRMNEWDSVGTP
jgi:hypothetical protein